MQKKASNRYLPSLLYISNLIVNPCLISLWWQGCGLFKAAKYLSNSQREKRCLKFKSYQKSQRKSHCYPTRGHCCFESNVTWCWINSDFEVRKKIPTNNKTELDIYKYQLYCFILGGSPKYIVTTKAMKSFCGSEFWGFSLLKI